MIFQAPAPQVQLYYVHPDHLGTPRAITRASDNQVAWRWDNTEPFGNSQPNQNPSGLGTFVFNLRFPGQYYDTIDATSGTHYNYFRDYDPGIGRYVQSDRIGLRGGINTYAYAFLDSLSNFDPLGLASINDLFDPGKYSGKLGKDITGKATLSEIGAAFGALCGLNCKRLRNPTKQTPEEAATEICNELIPEELSRGTAQGGGVFLKCKEKCLEVAKATCDKKTSCAAVLLGP